MHKNKSVFSARAHVCAFALGRSQVRRLRLNILPLCVLEASLVRRLLSHEQMRPDVLLAHETERVMLHDELYTAPREAHGRYARRGTD